MSEEKKVVKHGQRKRETGTVISNKMDKSISVAIQKRVPHPLYGKILTRTTKVYAHDEQNIANEGDTGEIMECRPLSKQKRWRLIKVLEKAKI
ncbi:MAG: 30S ribosomal protein S17 [Planctomycetes bacterium]|nr:30S ribosomal protein S17 [Planctomycetota bacterium]